MKGTMSQTPLRPGQSPQGAEQFTSIETGDRSASGLRSTMGALQKKLLLKPKKKQLNQSQEEFLGNADLRH